MSEPITNPYRPKAKTGFRSNPREAAFDEGVAAALAALESSEAVNAAAEAAYNAQEYRDPSGELRDDVHPGEVPQREPFLWAAVLEAGLWPGDVDECRRDARAVLSAVVVHLRGGTDPPAQA